MTGNSFIRDKKQSSNDNDLILSKEYYTLVLHAKFQRNRPRSYQDIAIVTYLTPLRFARGTCIRGHPHASTIVQLLVGGMKLPYKNYRM